MKTKKAKKSRNRVNKTKVRDLHEFFTSTSEQNYINPLDFLPYQVRQEILKNQKLY